MNEGNDGYVTKDLTYAAVPWGNKGYVIIHEGKQIGLKPTLDDAKHFIHQKHKKTKKPTKVSKSNAKLPIDK